MGDLAAVTSPPALTPLLALVESPDMSPVEYVIGGTTLSGAPPTFRDAPELATPRRPMDAPRTG
jgi:hypothetical protein